MRYLNTYIPPGPERDEKRVWLLHAKVFEWSGLDMYESIEAIDKDFIRAMNFFTGNCTEEDIDLFHESMRKYQMNEYQDKTAEELIDILLEEYQDNEEAVTILTRWKIKFPYLQYRLENAKTTSNSTCRFFT